MQVQDWLGADNELGISIWEQKYRNSIESFDECGSLHCLAFFDPDSGDLLETYLSKGSQGGCNNFMIGLSRMVSLAARAGCDIDSIIDQLDSSGVCSSYAVRSATKFDTSKGSCCPVAIGKALKEMWLDVQKGALDGTGKTGVKVDKACLSGEFISPNSMAAVDVSVPISLEACPVCRELLFHEGGCDICKNCGWSKCN